MDKWLETMQHITNDLSHGDYEQALHKMAASEPLADGTEERLIDLANLYFQLGHQDSAERMTDKVLEMNRGQIEALLIKGEVAVQREKWDEAVGWLERARENQADRPDVLVALADCYREMGLPEVAVTYLEQLVDQDPASPYYLLALGLTQLENNQVHAAIASLSRAYELDDQDVDILEALIQSLIEAGEWEESLPYLAEALRLSPERPDLAQTKAMLHYRIGETDEAVEQLTRLAANEPENSEIQTQLGEMQLVLGRLPAAKRTWETVHRLNPLDRNALLALGRIALREQEWQAALDYFHRTAVTGDGRDDVLIGMAEAYQGMEEWRQALHYYEQISDVVDETAPPAGIYHKMAHCHLALESYEAAIACLEKERQTTDDTGLRNQLADLYWQTGQRKKACEHWQASLALSPNQWEIAELCERHCFG